MPFTSWSSIFKTGRRSVASEDYPELEEILVKRPPLVPHQGAVDGLCALCNDEPATQEVGGTTVGDRCAERLMGVPGDSPTPYTEFGQKVYGSQHEAGIMDWLDRKLSPLAPAPGGRWSYDWCRYRHNSHCYYPGNLNGPATSFSGYPVFTPQDRGTCPRVSWEQQKVCPIGAPGPNSGEVMGAPDAIGLQQQQNRGGGGLLHRLFGSLDQKDQDFHWHFLAKWADVRAKASRIRKEGGVRIISAPSGVNPYIVAEVQGDYHTYQTTILRSLGRKSVAGWECTCAWAHYAWGRSGRWKKFEGRMCSHALATVFQAQADEMMGGTIKEVSERPKHFENPADYTYKPQPYEENWAKGRPKGTEGLENAWKKRTLSALQVTAHETERVPVSDLNEGDQVLLTGYEDQGPHTITKMWDGTPAPRIEPYEDKKERHLRGIIEHDDPDHYPPKDYGTIPIRHLDLAGGFDHVALPHHAPIQRLKKQSFHSVEASFSEERPIAIEVEALLEEGVHPNEVLAYLRAEGAPWPEYILTEALHQPFVARDPADELHTIVEVDGEHAVTDIGERIPVEHLTHPNFDWHSGLEPDSQLQMKSAKVVEDPTPHLNKDGSPHSGVMVALVPPGQVREGLAVQDGEPPEDMHVTVGYLGHKEGVDPDALHRAVSSFAAETPPLSGKVSGFGNFEVDPERNDGYSHAHVGLVDIPGIADFRSKLDEHLGREGLKVNDEHGLQPHLTVAYGHEPMEYDSMPETTSGFDLPHVTVAHGSTWTHYPLEGSKPTQEQTPKEGMLRWAAELPAGPLLNPHWQAPEPPAGRSKGRADDPNATKWSTYEPDFKQKIADQFHNNVPSELGVNTHRDMVENIKGMYREAKATNPSSVKVGKKWYSDAHTFAKNLAGKHKDGSLRKALGMTAALSPQNHWEENKTQAEYIHHHLSADPDSDDGRFNISPEHAQAAMDKQAEQASVVKGQRQVQQLTPGKRFADMDPEEAAHSLKAQAQYTHQLKVPGRVKGDGEPWRATFANGTGAIAKAVRIHRGEDPNDVLQGHKVRSFFNNMADPTNRKKRDDVTIDTHAVSLATGAKFGASAPAIKTMFANGANKAQNVTGTYGYFADAYRQAHKELVDSGEMEKNSAPHHLQAITWTHWRDLNDEPGPLKEANKGRFPDYSGTNHARQRAYEKQRAAQKAGQPEPMATAASLHRAAEEKPEQGSKTDPGKLLDPSNYDPEATDPDFDPELAEEAEDAEWDAEPEEMERRWQEEQPPPNPFIPHVSMLHWADVQGGDMDDETIDDDTSDAMDDAAQVQKDYSKRAEEAQDDWYFNQSPPPKSFDDTHVSIPVYMSALPYGTGMLKWSAEAAEEMLHDEPEGALPSTDGEGPSDLWESQHASTAQDPISAGPAGFGAPLDSSTTHEDLGYPERDEAVMSPSGFPGASEGSTINDLANQTYSLDYVSSLDTSGSPDLGANSRAWLLKGSSPRSNGDQGIRDADIAAMARRFLDTGTLPEGAGPSSKVAAKVFTPAEQQELIQEGSDGVRASNLDRLQLEGTHYLAGEDEDDPDLEGLFG